MPEHVDPTMGPIVYEGGLDQMRAADVLAGPGRYELGQRVAFRRQIGMTGNMVTVHGTVVRSGNSLGARYYHIQPDDTQAADETPAVVAEANIVGSLPAELSRESVEKWLETPEPR